MVATKVYGAIVCLCGRRGIEYQQLLKGSVLIVNYAIKQSATLAKKKTLH